MVNKEGDTDIFSLPKREREKRRKWHCSTPSHKKANGLQHPACYDKANGLFEKIGFLDIETYGSNFNAEYGFVVTYCIKELNGKIISGSICQNDLLTLQFDKPLLKKFIEDIKKFDRVVVQYGTDRKFDIPYLRTRALINNLSFPNHGVIYATDTWNIMRNKLKIKSNSLGYSCEVLGIRAKTHPLDWKVWKKIVSGNRKHIDSALKYIMQHNIEDVVSTEGLWNKIGGFVKLTKTSI